MRQLPCILIALAIIGVYGDEPDKLVNGRPAEIKDYPHCGSLRINNKHFCCANIIDKQYILTAAHCVVPIIQDPRLRESLTFVTGTKYLDKGGEIHKIEKLWYHDNYDPYRLGRGPYDIGLMKLALPIKFDSTQQPIKLPTKNIERNDDVTIAAWGSAGYKQPIHNDLQKLDAKAMLPDTCQTYHDIMNIHKNEFCTLITHGTGLCNGDSGSGLIQNSDGTIIGVVSGGRPCARGYPDVFTNVYSYISWIQNKINDV